MKRSAYRKDENRVRGNETKNVRNHPVETMCSMGEGVQYVGGHAVRWRVSRSWLDEFSNMTGYFGDFSRIIFGA